MNKSITLQGPGFEPGHVHQKLGKVEGGTPIHPLAGFLVDAGTVAVGVTLFYEKKIPVIFAWAGLGIAAVGAIRGLARLSEVG